jgi:hypothetical protein
VVNDTRKFSRNPCRRRMPSRTSKPRTQVAEGECSLRGQTVNNLVSGELSSNITAGKLKVDQEIQLRW